MPIKDSAKKALRQSNKKAALNAKVKRQIKDLIKKTNKLIEASKADEATKKMKEAIKAIDKAVSKKIYKKNNGSRKKSRLATKLNKVSKK